MQMFITLLTVLSAKVNVSVQMLSVSLTSKAPNTFLGPCVVIKC